MDAKRSLSRGFTLKAEKNLLFTNKGGASKLYLWIRVTADNNVNWARRALAQDCVDIIQRHVVNHSVVDLHDFITTPKSVEKKLSKCTPAPVYTPPLQVIFSPPFP